MDCDNLEFKLDSSVVSDGKDHSSNSSNMNEEIPFLSLGNNVIDNYWGQKDNKPIELDFEYGSDPVELTKQWYQIHASKSPGSSKLKGIAFSNVATSPKWTSPEDIGWMDIDSMDELMDIKPNELYLDESNVLHYCQISIPNKQYERKFVEYLESELNLKIKQYYQLFESGFAPKEEELVSRWENIVKLQNLHAEKKRRLLEICMTS